MQLFAIRVHIGLWNNVSIAQVGMWLGAARCHNESTYSGVHDRTYYQIGCKTYTVIVLNKIHRGNLIS